MSKLFRSGVAMFIIAGLCFLAAAITTVRYWMTGNASTASTGGTVAVGAVMLILGIVIRSKNTR